MPLCFLTDVGTGKHNLLFRKVKRILLVKHLRGVNLMRYILILLNSFMLIFVLNFYVRFLIWLFNLWSVNESNEVVDFFFFLSYGY